MVALWALPDRGRRAREVEADAQAEAVLTERLEPERVEPERVESERADLELSNAPPDSDAELDDDA